MKEYILRLRFPQPSVDAYDLQRHKKCAHKNTGETFDGGGKRPRNTLIAIMNSSLDMVRPSLGFGVARCNAPV